MPNYDSRIVQLYDGDNGDGPDHDFYRQLATELDARTIVDLGCGTGQLTVTLATPGRDVVGIDPSLTMINYARDRPGAERVRWINGDSSDLPDGDFDLALMTGNVAQHILDPDWARSLADLQRALRPGGVLAFETRNPVARAWEELGPGRGGVDDPGHPVRAAARMAGDRGRRGRADHHGRAQCVRSQR